MDIDKIMMEQCRHSILVGKYIEFKIAVWKYKENIPFREGWNESPDWWLSVIIRNCIYEIHRGDIALFYSWLLDENEGISKVIKEADLAINYLRHQDEYKERFKNNFDRKKESLDYISDPFVPRGNIHYLIIYQFSSSKGIYTYHREEAIYGEPDHDLWFDYYGVEEDDRGLIQYLDY